MNYTSKIAASLVVVLGASIMSSNVYADRDDVKALARAEISLIEAIRRAQDAGDGTAFEASIDDDSSTPEFEVSIVRDNRTYEVRVNAVTGEILSVREDNDN